MKYIQFEFFEVLRNVVVLEAFTNARNHGGPFTRPVNLQIAEHAIALQALLDSMLSNEARRKVECLIKEPFCQ